MMPRQLPWLNKGSGSRTQIKQSSKVEGSTKTIPDMDDDFFDGTVLAGSSKGKAKAIRNNDGSDNGLPDLLAEPSTPRTKSRTKYVSRQTRAASSSPPPTEEFVQPPTEYMRVGVSKFDLRDDEWMMVEDEFLETAKLFTRHLHIAEYKKLKERIEAKKTQAGITRPVVAGGKLSFEGKMKEKAKAQDIKQKKAIREVFASKKDEDDHDHTSNASFARPLPRHTPSSLLIHRPTTTSNRPTTPLPSHNSDSDDLDISRPISRHKPSNPASASALGSTSTPGQKSALPAPHSAFAKPALPVKQRGTISRRNRLTPFDMLDGYTPPSPSKTHTPAPQPAARSTSPVKCVTNTTPVSTVPEKSTHFGIGAKVDVGVEIDVHVDGDDDWGTSTKLRQATAERLAKRKAEREKERSEKRKTIKLEDIPTFLY